MFNVDYNARYFLRLLKSYVIYVKHPHVRLFVWYERFVKPAVVHDFGSIKVVSTIAVALLRLDWGSARSVCACMRVCVRVCTPC